MYGPEGRILNFNTAWCKVVQSQVSILKHANKIYNEHKNIMFLLNTTYTKILIYIEKVKKMFGPGPTGPYGSYAYGRWLLICLEKLEHITCQWYVTFSPVWKMSVQETLIRKLSIVHPVLIWIFSTIGQMCISNYLFWKMHTSQFAKWQ